jgi:hypothetical protein
MMHQAESAEVFEPVDADPRGRLVDRLAGGHTQALEMLAGPGRLGRSGCALVSGDQIALPQAGSAHPRPLSGELGPLGVPQADPLRDSSGGDAGARTVSNLAAG